MTAQIDLDEAERLGKAAAATPWVQSYRCVENWDVGFHIYDEGGHTEEDAAFIAYARNNWQVMIEEIRNYRHFQKKVAHGCADLNCKLCDE